MFLTRLTFSKLTLRDILKDVSSCSLDFGVLMQSAKNITFSESILSDIFEDCVSVDVQYPPVEDMLSTRV